MDNDTFIILHMAPPEAATILIRESAIASVLREYKENCTDVILNNERVLHVLETPEQIFMQL